MVGRGQEVDSQCETFWNRKPEFQNACAGKQIAVNPTGKMRYSSIGKKVTSLLATLRLS